MKTVEELIEMVFYLRYCFQVVQNCNTSFTSNKRNDYLIRCKDLIEELETENLTGFLKNEVNRIKQEFNKYQNQSFNRCDI